MPRLKGGKMGVLGTRSPHRPCPIGLSVAKVNLKNDLEPSTYAIIGSNIIFQLFQTLIYR